MVDKSIKPYYCKYCGTPETLSENLLIVGETTIIEKPFCPVCLAKGKYRKMLEVIDEKTKKT